MSNPNIIILENLPKINIAENINQIFDELLIEVHSYLKLDIINPQVKIEYVSGTVVKKQEDNEVLDLGVKRYIKNNYLVIEILDTYEKFLPFILLREVYYCFVPEILKNNATIKIFINQIVENDLQSLESIKEWKPFIRNAIVNYDFLSAELDRIEKFLKLQGNEIIESASIFFFDYIRRNVHLIDDSKDDFYLNLKKEFLLKTSRSIKNDEIIETIYILIKIFYKVKSYKALLEYQHYFKEFKEKGEIQTDLSLRKFTENIKWINNFTYIAPSYQINWNSINCFVLICKLTFNPLLEKKMVDSLIENLPFFLNSRSSESNFAVEIFGYFIAPKVFYMDISNFINNLEQSGYIIKKICFSYTGHENNINFNYFKKFHQEGKLINPNNRDYNEDYEIKFKVDFGDKFYKRKVSLLEFLILNRVRYWSIAGFSFERKEKTFRNLKTDLINEILSQRALITDLKNSLEIFHESPDIKREFLRFLEKNRNFGYFYIKEFLEKIVLIINLIENLMDKQSNIKNSHEFQEYIKKNGLSQLIEDNILYNNDIIQKIVYQEILPVYFKNGEIFRNLTKKYQIFADFFKNCYDLKIFNIDAMGKIINDRTLFEKIYSTKEKKLKESYESIKLRNIKNKDIDLILDDFLFTKPPVIIPLLINTMNTTRFAKYYIILILKNSQETQNILKRIIKYFPRVIINTGIDIFTNEEIIELEIYLPNLKSYEKEYLVSVLYNLFKGTLITIRRYFWSGFFEGFSRKDYYDFEWNEFFYTGDLFKQYFLYIQKLFGKGMIKFLEESLLIQNMFWSNKNEIGGLTNQIADRISREQVSYDIHKLNNLHNFHLNLSNNVLNGTKLKINKKKEFFRNYVKSIKILPVFQHFGLAQYYLYIRPITLKEIDFKLLLTNTFQSIKYPASISSSASLLIKYIFPFRNPGNRTYINWLTKSKRNISEYCFFFVKKTYMIFHFDYNLSSKGWDFNSNHFKTYAQKILFSPNFESKISKLRECNIGNLKISKFDDPNSSNFKNLIEIYNYNSLDIKSILGTKRHDLINKIRDLVKQNLIYPYIKLKNLSLWDKIYIIFPKLGNDLIEKILKIFSFFNFGFIHKIEGSFFIYNLPKEIKFENGLFIKIYLPSTDLSDFQKVFNSLFQLLKIKKYLILYDMVDGSNLIKSIYGNLDFLKTYNPLKNLIWNNKDNKWMNHKLFGENFIPNYPNLI